MGLNEGDEFDGLWLHPIGDRSEYHQEPADDKGLRAVEAMLGVRLPRSYVAMARLHNGGALARTVFPTAVQTTWAADHVAVSGIFAIGDVAPSSLCGRIGQRFWLEEWGYPALGVYFADTPSAGHDMVALDYRNCGPDGEPVVVHVDQELDYRVTYLAPNFEAFVSRLVPDVERRS